MKPTICAESTNPGSVIPGRHHQVASPESITLGQWLWIPGSRKSAPRNDVAYDSKFKNLELDQPWTGFRCGGIGNRPKAQLHWRPRSGRGNGVWRVSPSRIVARSSWPDRK